MRQLAFLGGVCLAAATVATAGEWQKSYAVGSAPVVDIRCGDANVDVRPGSSGRVEARVTSKGWEPQDYEVIERQQGDRVEIEVRMHRRAQWMHTGTRWIKVEVSTPAQTRLHVKTGDGNVTAHGISGEILLETGDGNIVADNLGGRVDAHTGDGNVRMSGRFEGLTVQTGDGNVELTADRASTAASSWRVQTGDGNVRLQVPADMRFDLDASTGDGHISADIPLVVAAGKVGGHQLRGKLNGGGPLFTLRTNDGNIHLASR